MVSRRRIKPLKSIVALVLALLLTVGQVLPVVPALTAQVHAQSQPVLTVTGTGLHQDVLIYEGDWSNYTEVVRYYSSNNNFDYHKIWKVKGYDLFELLGAQNLKTDQDYEVTFVAADGARVTRKISELQSQYYYPQFTVESGQLVAPMLGFYRAALYEPDFQGRPDPDEIIWEDRELTEADRDANALRLHMGQAEGQVSENNQSYFLRDLVRIIVGEERPTDPGDDEFKDSPYKHINYEGPPYNIDTLTGATMTVEGPGMESYRALSLRQLEETAAEGLYRGTYLENIDGQTVENSYEGIRISYILDNYVTLRANVGKIVFKNYLRQEIAEFTLDEIRDESRMLIAAYGVNEVPFVYTNLDPGYIPSKYNDRGCLKLVYHPAEGEELPTFINVAYIYVEEDERPGYEHDKEPYNDPSLTQYIFTLGGSGLGKEVNYTTADLEAMTDLHLEKEYCLSNSYYYWYYNTYKGIPLWDLLLHAGMDPDIDENTPVHFKAADYYNIPSMTIGDIKHHDRWAYYEKNPEDRGDGTFDGSNEVPLETGYPVMVAFGFNGYPYVKHPTDPGYNSGLGNDGGPLRIIFGKRDYDHTNGSHQVKYAIRVIVGDDLPYTTHSYDPYDQLADETLTVTVVGEDGTTIKEEPFTVSEIEEMIYGEDVPAATADRARGKGYYFTHFAGGAGGTPISDLYEGIDLNYFLFEKIGLPGTVGTVTFTSSDSSQQSLVVSLEDIPRTDYFNEFTGVSGLKSILAFAKNGYPLVSSSGDPGYIGSPIVNRYGPLLALFGQTEEGSPGRQLRTVNSITVNMSTDPYAHLNPPYDQYAADELTISGDGVRKEHTVTVGELEFMQNYIFTGEYCLAKSETEKESAVYRGIDIYDFLRREVGFTAGADTITFKAADGSSQTFGLDEIAKADYINEITGAANLKVMLAFGKSEKPLVPSKDSEGYDAEAGNDGGPLRLVIGQTEAGDLNRGKSVKNVTEIIVNASAGDSWKHDYGVYTQYLDLPVLRVTGSQVKEPRTFSLRQLQALDEHIIRDIYMGETEVEGIIMWKLIKDVVGLADGVTIPSSIRVFDGPQYNQLHNVSQVMNGVVNSQGLTKEIILGYAINGYPLVPHAHSPGYVYNNEYGPLRVIVEENISMWTKWVDCIVVGEGDYEEPKAEDIITGPTVFTVSGGGVPGGSREYTLEQLQALGETTGEYSYTSGGELITDQATGVLLADILADLGITNPAWEISITATDGFDAGAVTLQEVIDQEYLVAYLVNGEPFEDTKDGYDSSTIRIYRRFNDGSNWRNRLTLVNGVIVTSTDVFTVSGDGVPGGTKGYALAQLQALGETTGEYSYTSGGELITDQATGVLLADILADLGITDPAWEISITATDGFDAGAVTLQEVIDQEYLVAYLVNGEPFEDTKDGYDSSTIRIYRRFNDGSNWRNRLTLVNGVIVTSTEPPPVFTISGDGVPGGTKEYTLEQLQALAETTASYSYQSKGSTVTVQATGVLLADILADLGITNPAWEIKLVTSDGYEHETYTVNLHTVTEDDYLVAYEVDGTAIDPAVEVLDLYRHHDDGSTWLNRAKDVCGVEVTSTDLELPWIYYRNDDGSGLPLYAVVRCITPDQKGGLWVGTNGAGAAYRDAEGNWTIYNTSNSPLPHNAVHGIAVDDADGVWFVGGSKEEGMGAVYMKDGNWTIYTSENSDLPADYGLDVAIDELGGVWFGTAEGLAYKDRNNVWRIWDTSDGLPAQSVTRIAFDKQRGGVWVGFHPEAIGEQGGYAYIDASGQVTPHTAAAGEPGTWIRSFSFDNEGGLWVSRFDTVDYIAPDGSKTVYSGKELVPFLGDTDGILYVEADQEGNLWIGLYPGGLLRLDPSGQLRTVASWLTAQFSVVWYMHTCPSGAFYTGGNGGIAMLPAPGPAGSNADLKSLTCSSGTLMPAFDPANTDYRILIADESAGVPEIGATVADTGRAVREIRNAASFTDKAQVTVTAEDGTQKIYTIGFMREILLPAPGTADDPAQVNVEVGEITDLYLDISPDDADKYAINITVPAGAETPTLMVNTVAVEGGRQAVLPAISIESSLSIEGEWQPVRVDIAAGTTVTGPADWDGVLQLPAVKEKPSVSIDGDVSVVLELGLLQGELLFDKAVRLHIPGQAGKNVGYIENGVFTEITRILSEDSQAYAEAQLPPGGDGKIDIGADLVVWTRHFTEFVTYTPAPEEPGPEPGDDEPGDDETPKDPLPRTWGGWTHLFMLFVAAFTLICGGLFISLNRRRTAGR